MTPEPEPCNPEEAKEAEAEHEQETQVVPSPSPKKTPCKKRKCKTPRSSSKKSKPDAATPDSKLSSGSKTQVVAEPSSEGGHSHAQRPVEDEAPDWKGDSDCEAGRGQHQNGDDTHSGDWSYWYSDNGSDRYDWGPHWGNWRWDWGGWGAGNPYSWGNWQREWSYPQSTPQPKSNIWKQTSWYGTMNRANTSDLQQCKTPEQKKAPLQHIISPSSSEPSMELGSAEKKALKMEKDMDADDESKLKSNRKKHRARYMRFWRSIKGSQCHFVCTCALCVYDIY